MENSCGISSGSDSFFNLVVTTKQVIHEHAASNLRMKNTEIDIKIKEYEKKLNSKCKVIVGKRTKNRRPPPHLRKYYKEEIEKLEKLKLSFENIKTKKIIFTWDNVIFEDFKIRLIHSNRIYGPIQLKDSKKSFEYLKPYFRKLNLKEIVCMVKGNEITEISNLEEIYEIIQVFNFKNIILNFSEYKTSDFQESINKLKNNVIISITDLTNKSEYLNYLINLNTINFKIIPLLENNHSDEDSFIFTIKNNNVIYLVWESCLEKKATYIFSTTTKEYTQTLIKIAKFILSEQTTRIDLRQNFIRENLNEIKSELIYHNNFKDWKGKLTKKLLATVNDTIS